MTNVDTKLGNIQTELEAVRIGQARIEEAQKASERIRNELMSETIPDFHLVKQQVQGIQSRIDDLGDTKVLASNVKALVDSLKSIRGTIVWIAVAMGTMLFGLFGKWLEAYLMKPQLYQPLHQTSWITRLWGG